MSGALGMLAGVVCYVAVIVVGLSLLWGAFDLGALS